MWTGLKKIGDSKLACISAPLCRFTEVKFRPRRTQTAVKTVAKPERDRMKLNEKLNERKKINKKCAESGHYPPLKVTGRPHFIFTHVVHSLSFAGHLEITIKWYVRGHTCLFFVPFLSTLPFYRSPGRLNKC